MSNSKTKTKNPGIRSIKKAFSLSPSPSPKPEELEEEEIRKKTRKTKKGSLSEIITRNLNKLRSGD